MKRATRLVERLWSLPRRYRIGALTLVVLVLVLVVYLRSKSGGVAADTTTSGIPHVTISSVASLSSRSGPLPVTGKVSSRNEATILAQTSGEIVTLSRALGDRVLAGGVIAQFENSSQIHVDGRVEGLKDRSGTSK